MLPTLRLNAEKLKEESTNKDSTRGKCLIAMLQVAEHVIMQCITLFQMDTRSGKIDLSKSYSPDALYNLFHFNFVLTLTAESCLTLRLAGVQWQCKSILA